MREVVKGGGAWGGGVSGQGKRDASGEIRVLSG